MHRLLLLLPLLAACHGEFAPRTTEEDKAINNFAEARLRGATYYQGGDYVRAAQQYRKALDYRPTNGACLLGYAYSLMRVDQMRELLEARKQFEAMKRHMRDDQEVKRVHGLGLTHRAIAVAYESRARSRNRAGRVKEAEQDAALARAHARDGLKEFGKVLAGTDKASLLLLPDAHIGSAHCEILLGTAEDRAPFDRAVAHIKAFADIADKARRFWSQNRERIISADPYQDDAPGDTKATEQRAMELQKAQVYEAALNSLRPREIAVRKALVETYFFLNRIEEGIAECNVIEQLDPEDADVLYFRGRAYAYLNPPDYAAALRDLNRYRAKKLSGALTEEMIQLNRLIRSYEEKLETQKSASGAG